MQQIASSLWYMTPTQQVCATKIYAFYRLQSGMHCCNLGSRFLWCYNMAQHILHNHDLFRMCIRCNKPIAAITRALFRCSHDKFFFIMVYGPDTADFVHTQWTAFRMLYDTTTGVISFSIHPDI